MRPLYRVFLKPAAERALDKLPKADFARVKARILALSVEPRPHGVVKLAGEDDLYRVRSGDYRVLYRVEEERLVVLVVRVANRREAYR